MTPEQEILVDAITSARQRATKFSVELQRHGKILPLDPNLSWDAPDASVELDVTAFIKRFEMMQDQITRKLFRSVLVAKGVSLRTNALAEVMAAIAELGIITDAKHWEVMTKLRNAFAHDYVLSFAELVPMINQAWDYCPDLIAMVERVADYANAHIPVSSMEGDK